MSEKTWNQNNCPNDQCPNAPITKEISGSTRSATAINESNTSFAIAVLTNYPRCLGEEG